LEAKLSYSAMAVDVGVITVVGAAGSYSPGAVWVLERCVKR
jgi:hypothetical protein